MPETLMLTPAVGNAATGSRPAEIDLLLSCARTHITPEIADRIRAAVKKDINWIALIRLAMRHEVMPLLYRGLQQVCAEATPPHILAPLRTRYEEQAAQSRRRTAELLRILTAFKSSGVFAVPYKGPALAQRLYGDLALREFGDLDIMVRDSDVPKAQEVIRGQGYEFATPADAENLPEYIRTNRELQFFLRGVSQSETTQVELQWRFAIRSACIAHDPDRFLQRIETLTLAGAEVPSLPLETYLLILSLHATKHKWKELKLICDIAEILRCPDLDWDYVLNEAHDLGLRRMLAVGVLLAEDPLETAVSPKVIRGLKIDSTARSLAAEVRDGLFEEHDKTWLNTADFPFQFKIRERLRDRANMLRRNLPEKLTPDERDRLFLPLPASLAPIYYLVRPVRWAWEKINIVQGDERQPER